MFDARGLRVGGPYKIIGKAAKFADQTLTDVYLTVGDAGRVTLNFVPADEVASVTVTAKKKSYADLANVGSRTTLKSADIETVVSVKRDLRDVARRDPLAQLDFVTRGTGPSGGVYIAGSSPRRNRITIDGVRSQDDYGLNTGGLSTNRGPVSLEAIEQVAIQATPFDVEEGDFTGGAINMILKSGGNDFHGSVFDLYRTPRLIGNKFPTFSTTTNADGSINVVQGQTKVRNYVHDQNYGGFLSGPIIPDKLYFAVSYEKFSSYDLTSTGPAGQGFGTAFNPIPGVSTGAKATAADINTVLNTWNSYAASSQLKPGQVDLVKPVLDEKSSVKIDYNITDTQRLSASYRHAFSSVWKRTTGINTISLDTNWYVQPENEDNYAVQLNSKWSPELSTEARLSYRGYQRGQLPPEGQGFAQVSVCTDAVSVGSLTSCGSPTISFGPDQFRQANVLKTNDLAGDFAAYYRLWDTHQLKVGYQYKGIHIYNLFVQAAHGTYYFDSQADFAAGKANQFGYGTALDGNPLDTAAILSYNVHTLFAQDTWDVTPNFTVNYGVRYDSYGSDKVPALNTNFVNRFGFGNTATYDGRDILMPRASAKWRTSWFELSGGVGLVSGGIPDVLLGNSYGAQTGATNNSFTLNRTAVGANTYFNASTSSALDPAIGNALLNIDPSNPNFIRGPAAVGQTLISADSATRRNAFTNSIDPHFDIPADWKANLSFKTAKFGWDFGVDAVLTWSDTNIAFRDIRSRLLTVNGVQQYTPDGRIRYDGLQVAGATPAAVTAARVALGLPTSSNPDQANVSSNGDIQAYNPKEQNWNETLAFSAARTWKNLDLYAAYVIQDGKSYGGVSEFGTTEGGNSSGGLQGDQDSARDPNASVLGTAANVIKQAVKIELSYKREIFKGLESRFSLFGESRSGRPISFQMSDPNIGSGRSTTFGVWRDDQLLYVPNLSNPVAVTNPNTGGTAYQVTTGNTVVYFKDATTLAQFKSLVRQFGLPQGQITPKGFGQNPHVDRFDFQYAQELPTPIAGNKFIFTVDITNLGNLLNKKWGVVKEYSSSRSGTVLVNAQCADATGKLPTAANPAACSSYYYSYSSATAAATASKPTIVDIASLWSIELGLKYKF